MPNETPSVPVESTTEAVTTPPEVLAATGDAIDASTDLREVNDSATANEALEAENALDAAVNPPVEQTSTLTTSNESTGWQVPAVDTSEVVRTWLLGKITALSEDSDDAESEAATIKQSIESSLLPDDLKEKLMTQLNTKVSEIKEATVFGKIDKYIPGAGAILAGLWLFFGDIGKKITDFLSKAFDMFSKFSFGKMWKATQELIWDFKIPGIDLSSKAMKKTLKALSKNIDKLGDGFKTTPDVLSYLVTGETQDEAIKTKYGYIRENISEYLKSDEKDQAGFIAKLSDRDTVKKDDTSTEATG